MIVIINCACIDCIHNVDKTCQNNQGFITIDDFARCRSYKYNGKPYKWEVKTVVDKVL